MPVVAAMLMNQEVIDKFGAPSAAFYRSKGIIDDVGSIDRLAAKLGVDIDTIKRTLTAYQVGVGCYFTLLL